MYLKLIQFTKLLMFCDIYMFIFLLFVASDAQTIKNDELLLSSFPNQATNSTVTASVIGVYSADGTSLQWSINGEVVGAVGFIGGEFIIINTTTIFSDRITVQFERLPSNSATIQLKLSNLQSSDLKIAISAGPILATRDLNVVDCNLSLPYNVEVDALSETYNSVGTFSCSNNGELFYSNASDLTSNATTCLANAMWSGQNNLQCWTAPTVTLSGVETVIEGNELVLTCDYVQVIPDAVSSTFYIGDIPYSQDVDSDFTTQSLNASDNGKQVYCQANSPFTQIPEFNQQGRSTIHTLDVQYSPRASSNSEVECPTWVVNQTGTCTFQFISNPLAPNLNLTLNGNEITNDNLDPISNISEVQTYTFQRNMVSQADNGSYTLTIQSSAFPATPLVVEFDVIVSDTPIDPGDPGGLDTTIIIVVVVVVVVVILCAVLGYFCYRRRSNNKKTSGSNNSSIPIQDINSERETKDNPLYDTQSYPQTVNSEKEERNNPLYGSSGGNVAEDAYAVVDKPKNKKKKKVNNEKVERDNPLYGTSGDNVAEDAYAVVDKTKGKKKKKDNSEKEERNNPLYGSSGGNVAEDAYAVVDKPKNKKKKKGKEEKEEKVNPLYQPGDPDFIEDAYAEVDKPKKKKGKGEKEEKVNPLYAPSTSAGVSEAYAEVDFSKKKKKKKEEGSTPDDTYAEVKKPKPPGNGDQLHGDASRKWKLPL